MTAQRHTDTLTEWLDQKMMKQSVDRREPKAYPAIERSGYYQPASVAGAAETPRHVFMPGIAHKAYENTALPIGNGQTISQPQWSRQ